MTAPRQAPVPTPSATSRAGRNLPAAIGTGLALVVAIVATLGVPMLNGGFVLLVAVALSFATIELHNALKRIGMTTVRTPIIVGTVLAVVVPYLARLAHERGHDFPVHPAGIVFTIVGFTVVVALALRMREGTHNYVRDAAASLFTIAYIPLLGSFVTLMLAETHGAARVTAFILVVAGSDTGGYVAGVLFGKHKMAPVVSPKKTWEGLAGSFVMAMAVAVLFAVFVFHVAWWTGLVTGAVVTVAAVVGDLVESMIKRDVGIKDMSSFLPGHGGIMDRLDSLLVSAPWAWLCMFLMVPGA